MTNQPTIRDNDPIQAARDLLAQDRVQEAIEALDKVQENPDALKAKARVLVKLGKTDEAIACYEKIVEIRPDNPSALAQLAEFLTGQGRYPEAVEFYDRAIQLDSDEATFHSERGLALRLSGDFESALGAYETALDIDDDDANTWSAKADLLIGLHRFDEAIECLEKASAAASGLDANDWTNRGYRLARAGALEEAVHCFDRAVEQSPGESTAHLGKATALRWKGDTKGALACADRVIDLQPESASGHTEKAQTLIIEGRFNEAIESYEAALERDPIDNDSWADIGYCRFELGHHTEALRDYSKAIALDPGFARAWEGKGNCLQLLGRHSESVSAYRTALELEPNRLWANNNLGWVLSSNFNRHEEALEYFNKSIELYPGEVYPQVNKAQSLMELGRIEEAKSLLEESLGRVRPEQKGTVLWKIGVLYAEHFNNSKRALELFNQAEKLGPIEDLQILSIAEQLVQLGRHEEARARASDVLAHAKEPWVRSVGNFLLFASHTLDGDPVKASEHFNAFIDCMAESGAPAVPSLLEGKWSYRGLVNSIVEGSTDSVTKFILLVAIDLQEGNLSAPSLSVLRESLPLRPSPDAPLPQLPDEEPGVLNSLLTRLRDFVRERTDNGESS